VSLALLLACDLRFLRTLSEEGNAIELVPTLRFGLCPSSSGDALGSMIGKTQLARMRARMEKKVNAASSDEINGNLIARPLKRPRQNSIPGSEPNTYRAPRGTARPSREADNTLSSRPLPSPMPLHESARPISTWARIRETPGTKLDSSGTVISTTLGFLKKIQDLAGTAMALSVLLETGRDT
jgi:hypothetical protein